MVRQLAKLAGYSAVINGLRGIVDEMGEDSWIVGTNVRYGVFLEFGTRNMPPYPWMRPAIEEVMQKDADRIADNASGTDELVQELALAIERRAKQRTDSRDQRPFRQTGNLSASIEAIKL